MQFDDLRLTEPLLRAVRTARYVQPTPIQADAIPLVLAGRDVLGCAQTGTGKTAAFALPIIQRLSDRSGRATKPAGGVRALVLCPTRELAQQIFESFRTYGQFTGIRQAVVFGGVKQGPQVRALRAGVDVLIATPGRLLDLMGQRVANVRDTEILVLDEADRMLDMGFLPDLRRILAHLPGQRQTLLFSATMPAPIRTLAGDILSDPASVQVDRVSSPAPSVTHSVYHVEKSEKPTLLAHLLAQAQYTRALVFTRTKHGADKVVKKLVNAGVPAAAIHGNKSQNARTRALAEFKSAKTPVLIATDIAARGLDVEGISHVINYDLTHEPETYVHRIGRTGRAGATGIAVSFCTSQERGLLRDIERLLREPLEWTANPLIPGDSPPAPIRPTPQRAFQPQPHTRRSRPRRSLSRGPNRGSRPRKPSPVSVAW
ncbi:MAG: DEAD/DEAH box helicase [Planctomycetes bacterium]|nr:DEAD/DEAH box helicase [Planctomycetota bacterium]